MDKAFSVLKEISVKLFWCPKCNVPILGRRCNICNSPTIPVKLTPPGDVRPALGFELKRVYSLLEKYLGKGWEKIVPKRKVVLLNKIQYPDMADEVIIDGQVICHRYYDLWSEEWRIKPSYPLSFKMVEEKTGYYAILNLPKITRGYEVHRNKIVEIALPEDKEYVAVGTLNKKMYGIAKVIRGKRLRITKVWLWRRFSWNRSNPSWKDVIRANERRLLRIEEEAINFVKEVHYRYKLPVFVSFSGGKDSLVTYHIVAKALGKVPILFNDTGIELPDTVSYVKEFARKNNLELIVADAEDSFWRGVNVLGPPARDYRWCCKLAKLAPISKKVKTLFPKGALSFVGQRKFESAKRAVSPRIWRNRWMPEILAAAPILTWTSLDVWMYILFRKLIPNKLYYLGFDRLGCWLCPASEMGEFKDVKRLYPSLWERWDEYLKKYAISKKLPKEWIKYGLWRWIKVPGDVKREIKVDYVDRRGVDLDINKLGSILLFKINNKNLLVIKDRLFNFIKTTNLKGELEYDISDNLIKLKLKEKELNYLKVVKAVIRALFCIGCELCVLHCPSGALKSVKGQVKISNDLCTGCGYCNELCPIGEYVLIAQNFSEIAKI